ncbi:MAG: hypothetical protein QOF78_1374, partial [Phycisphaerales bacterium]|nr:hypothetical protein [Phycisphaerales bacterium]
MTDDRPADDAEGNVLNYRTPPAHGIQWVNVWKARNTMEANLAVATLQEHGIHARVDMENAADLGLLYEGIANSKVQVIAEQADAARTLLLEIDQQRAKRQDAASLKCPNCNTPNPKRIMHPLRWAAWAILAGFVVLIGFAEARSRWSAWVLLLVPVGLAMLVWGVTPRWRCKRCGHPWYAN